jgi:SPP1 gp7 family putative phage head morphogenesis protein
MNPLVAALLAAGVINRQDADTLTLMLDPEAAQAYAERLLTQANLNGLTAQQMRLIDLVRTMGFEVHPDAIDVFWQREDELLATAWVDEYGRVASSFATATLMETNGLAAWQATNTEVIDWVNTYYRSGSAFDLGSIPNINGTSRAMIADIFNQWQAGTLDVPRNIEGLPRLIRALQPVFGTERASAIGVTETTRIYARSVQTAALNNERVTVLALQTAADELVCPICGPMHGQRVPKDAGGFRHPLTGVLAYPPFHVNCRCRHVALTEAVQSLVVPEDTFTFA